MPIVLSFVPQGISYKKSLPVDTTTRHGFRCFMVRVYTVFWVLSFVTFFLISVALDKIGSDLPPPMLHRGFERDPASWGGAYRVHKIPQGLKSEIC